MAKPELIQSISLLSKKIDSLLERQRILQEKIQKLEEINRELTTRHQHDVEEIEKARKDIEFLSLSHRLADSPEALVSARKIIARLIRNVDSCIRMIKED